MAQNTEVSLGLREGAQPSEAAHEANDIRTPNRAAPGAARGRRNAAGAGRVAECGERREARQRKTRAAGGGRRTAKGGRSAAEGAQQKTGG